MEILEERNERRGYDIDGGECWIRLWLPLEYGLRKTPSPHPPKKPKLFPNPKTTDVIGSQLLLISP